MFYSLLALAGDAGVGSTGTNAQSILPQRMGEKKDARGDLATQCRMKRTLDKIKCLLKRIILAYPKTLECNVCEWRGRRFVSDAWQPRQVCPSCNSQIRHRLMVAAMQHLEELSFQRILQSKRVLHFAPEIGLQAVFRHYADEYVTADFIEKNVDMTGLDIANMSALNSGSFDLVIACDVLEHVDNDVQALREMHRVVAAGGMVIVSVPQITGLNRTLDDSEFSIRDPYVRTHLFGIDDHRRIYGNDFALRLESAGFRVAIVDESKFTSELRRKHVLVPPALSGNPALDGRRRVYFASKA